MLDRKVLFVSMLILVFLAIGTVSATDNLTDEISWMTDHPLRALKTQLLVTLKVMLTNPYRTLGIIKAK